MRIDAFVPPVAYSDFADASSSRTRTQMASCSLKESFVVILVTYASNGAVTRTALDRESFVFISAEIRRHPTLGVWVLVSRRSDSQLFAACGLPAQMGLCCAETSIGESLPHG